jgi:predicted LPLAT superfamily acyltransferase
VQAADRVPRGLQLPSESAFRGRWLSQAWLKQPERGTVITIRLLVALALTLGRRVARWLLYPVCLYFIVFSVKARRASRNYLARVLVRKPRVADVFRHYLTFATVALDRFYLLKERYELFQIDVHNEQVLLSILKRGQGCLLLGAHIGSFEVLRALGTSKSVEVGMVMYEDNARMVNTLAKAINPELAKSIIALGRFDSMLKVQERLQQSQWVGILGDRTLDEETQQQVEFLGDEVGFSIAPFQLAWMLKRPVIFMVGLYRGGNRYELRFKELFDPTTVDRSNRGTAMHDGLNAYVKELERCCREAPFNWFNFYDYWNELER